MKKIIAPLLLLAITMNTFCQQIDSSLTKADYLRKSKNQKIAAYALLGGGLSMFVAAGIIGTQNLAVESPEADALFVASVGQWGPVSRYL